MNPEILVNELFVQQKELEALQKKLMNTSITKDEVSQTFLFDLKDYVDSLSLVTEYAEESTTKSRQVEELSALLGEQSQTLRNLIQQLEKMEESEQQDFFGQKAGELRRTIAGLKGIVELNGLLLQDNLTFQRKWKDAGSPATIKDPTSEKPGFFQRLFGKN